MYLSSRALRNSFCFRFPPAFHIFHRRPGDMRSDVLLYGAKFLIHLTQDVRIAFDAHVYIFCVRYSDFMLELETCSEIIHFGL